MQTAAISSLSSATAAGIAPAAAAGAAAEAPFGDLLRSTVAGVDNLEQQAASAVQGLMQGTGVDIHDAMIATQKADMAFELTLAVRNKAVAAYQQVMSMQF
ncbi:MAG TPA: flagellar hook-basal body complex protein FliE [Acidobacteriaceae bacterium]|nr:flagellar hook-basal body complex protein FliE [Acidobacteriaceae bacterium]